MNIIPKTILCAPQAAFETSRPESFRASQSASRVRNSGRCLLLPVLCLGLLPALLSGQGARPQQPFQIDSNFPGGNIIVLNINGDTVQLQQDLRDTERFWFYWSFRVKGAAGRTLNFEFINASSGASAGAPAPFHENEIKEGSLIGCRGPAASTDDGLTWRWLGDLGATPSSPDLKFQYTFGPAENEVIFGQGMNYTEKDLRRFLNKHKNHPDLAIETLCLSRKGRNVELLRIRDKNRAPDFKIFLSSRMHCGEMMATRALEGIMEAVLADTEDGRWLRRHGDFFIVPFADKDGVEDGDQGKNRRPHDHGRDARLRIYPETRAITDQVPKWLDGKPLFSLDMHCPALRGGSDGNAPEKGSCEYFYFVGINPTIHPGQFEQLKRFGTILEAVKKGPIPYQASFNVPFGITWNTEANRKSPDHISLEDWAATLPNVVFSGLCELPFANASGVVVDANSARELGHDLAKAIRVYLENIR